MDGARTKLYGSQAQGIRRECNARILQTNQIRQFSTAAEPVSKLVEGTREGETGFPFVCTCRIKTLYLTFVVCCTVDISVHVLPISCSLSVSHFLLHVGMASSGLPVVKTGTRTITSYSYEASLTSDTKLCV